MTTYNTGNQLGSTDPRDLFDNSQNFDNALNGAGDEWVDRLGNIRKSFNGLIKTISLLGNPYSTLELAIQDIASGVIKNNSVFSVISSDDNRMIDLYVNNNGVATYTGKSEIDASYVEGLSASIELLKQFIPQEQGNKLSGYLFMFTDVTGEKGLIGMNEDGGLEVAGIQGAIQDYLSNLVTSSFAGKISGYQVVIFAQDLKTVMLAIDDDGGLWLPGMSEAVQDAIGSVGPALVRPCNGWNALFANKDSQTPLWSRQPVISATPVTKNGVSFVYEENGVLKSGLMPTKWPANEVYGPPCELSPIAREVHAYFGRGQSLRVGGGNRISTLNPIFKGRLFMFSGAGQDRGQECQQMAQYRIRR